MNINRNEYGYDVSKSRIIKFNIINKSLVFDILIVYIR